MVAENPTWLQTFNPRQTASVINYLRYRNGAQAVREAGYSLKSANSRAAQLLAKPRIQEILRQEQSRARDRAELSLDQWLRQTTAIAFHDRPRSP